MKRKLALLTAALSLFAASACGSSSSSGSGDSDTSGKGVGTHTIGILQSTSASEVIQRWAKTAQTALADIGWKAEVVDGKGDPGVFQSAMQGFISKKVSGIIVIAVDAPAITTQLQDAKSANIPVISAPLSTSGAGADLFTARYAPDDKEFGTVLAGYLKDKLAAGSEYGVLDISAVTGAHNAVVGATPILDEAGFKEVGKVDMDPADIVNAATKGTQSLLQAHPDMKLLFSCCDFTPAITAAVIGDSHPDVIQAARYDNLSTLELIRKGSNIVVVTANADTAVLLAVDQFLANTVSGKKIDGDAGDDAFKFSIVDKDSLPAEGAYVNDPQEQIDTFVAKWKKEYSIS